MTVKEYREAMGMRQADLVEELKFICPELTVPLLSYIERGVVEAPEDMLLYLSLERQFRNEKMACQSEEKDDIDKCIEVDEESFISSVFDRDIYDRLRALKDGERLTRDEIVYELGIPDRIGRRSIESMRSKGARIASGGGAPGYFLCKTDEEYRQFEREYLSRAYKALKTAKAMRDSKIGQVVIDV